MSSDNRKDKNLKKSLSEINTGNTQVIPDSEQLVIVGGGKKNINKDNYNTGISTPVPC